MAHPVTKEFNCNQTELMQGLQKAAKDIDLPPAGERVDLGVASFRLSNNEMLYAHFAPQDKDRTTIALATGLPYLETHEQSELPLRVINKLLDRLKQYL
ncbi:MAG TPA: hypothetical protein VK112_09050 [Fodinibius sp.]|nr:hypothetical protein [Fodinibius sp.]